MAGVKLPCVESSETERLDGEVSEAGRMGEETAEAKVAVSVPVSSKSHFLYNSANGFGAEPVVVYRRKQKKNSLLYTYQSPRDRQKPRIPSSGW